MGEQLYIPSFIVRAAGFMAGDTAFVTNEDPDNPSDKPVCVLLKEKPEKAINGCAVSKDCHILITLTMLKNCGLNADGLDIDGNNGKLVIRKKLVSKESSNTSRAKPVTK
jgi:hypothetical protein